MPQPLAFLAGERSPSCSNIACWLVISLLVWQGRREFESLLGEEFVSSYSCFLQFLFWISGQI